MKSEFKREQVTRKIRLGVFLVKLWPQFEPTRCRSVDRGKKG